MIDPAQLAVTQVPILDLQQHPENANNGDLDALEESVATNGFYSPLIVQQSTGYILAGNHRYVIAVKKGMTHIPAIVIDVTDDEALRIMVADNRITRKGHDDEGQLLNILDILQRTDDGLAGTGYSTNDHEFLLALINDPLVDADFQEPEDPAAPLPQAIPQLNFTIMPIRDDTGRCYAFEITRPNLRHMTPTDLNVMRKAFGQSPLSKEQIATYDVGDWQ
jgi:ParB-like chromosome segregation protein Spo0J